MKHAAPSRATPGERILIEAIRHQAAAAASGSPGVRVGIGDDCAVLRPRRGHEICVTTDFTLEGTHFRRDWHPPESVGHRCLARGLSDLAAMGADPIAVFLSIALPAKLPTGWIEGFVRGFLTLARRYKVDLAGGDTAESRSGLIAADIIAVGQTPVGRAVRRFGARAGDRIYVTGALGGAAAELRDLSRNPRSFRRIRGTASSHPHFYPEPRLIVGRRLRGIASAMIDLSDGLSTDLSHICEESHVAAILEEEALPIHPLARQNPEARKLALHGGEDYELLFTARSAVRVPRSIAGVPIHPIGILGEANRRQPRILLNTLDEGRIAIAAGGWQHFARPGSAKTESFS